MITECVIKTCFSVQLWWWTGVTCSSCHHCTTGAQESVIRGVSPYQHYHQYHRYHRPLPTLQTVVKILSYVTKQHILINPQELLQHFPPPHDDMSVQVCLILWSLVMVNIFMKSSDSNPELIQFQCEVKTDVCWKGSVHQSWFNSILYSLHYPSKVEW